MKLNLVNVLNTIAVENESEAILRDPDASWNINPETELKNAYDDYKMWVEMENDYTIDLIEHCISYGWDYDHIKCKKVLTWDEWLTKENKTRANYMTNNAGISGCPFAYLVTPNAFNKMVNLVNNNRQDAINTFVNILAA